MYYDMQSDRLYDDYAMEGILGNIKDTVVKIIDVIIHKLIDAARYITKKKELVIDKSYIEELKTIGIQSNEIREFKSKIVELKNEVDKIKKCVVSETDTDKITEYKESLVGINKKIATLTKILYSSKSTKESNTARKGDGNHRLTKAFYDAVDSGNVLRVRIMMKDSLLVDPSFKQVAEMEKVALPKMDGLFDEHDGRELNPYKSTWDDDFMNKMMVQIIGNFSHKRLNHLKQIVRHLRPEKIK